MPNSFVLTQCLKCASTGPIAFTKCATVALIFSLVRTIKSKEFLTSGHSNQRWYQNSELPDLYSHVVVVFSAKKSHITRQRIIL